MVYICPINSSIATLISIFFALADHELYHIQKITKSELIKGFQSVDIEHGIFPIVLTDTEYGEREVVEKYQIAVEIFNTHGGRLPDFNNEDQIIILGNITHILITIIENF